MAGTYIKLFVDSMETMAPLSDSERGILVSALLQYRKDGTIPQLSGNERFLFPVFKAQIDRDVEAYEMICERNRGNGMKGGRPQNPLGSRRTQTNPDKPSVTQKSQDKDKDKDKDKDNITATHKFVKPTIEEVAAYTATRNVRIDASHFYDYYESKGWLVGKSPMKDWKAAVRNWERSNGRSGDPAPQQKEPEVTHQYGLGTGG